MLFVAKLPKLKSNAFIWVCLLARGCFKEYFIHKFRAMLGKNRVIFPGEKVLNIHL
jgi:hypothetical protein